MSWTKPDFEEFTLCMEVTAYANSEGELPTPINGGQQPPAQQAVFREIDEKPAE